MQKQKKVSLPTLILLVLCMIFGFGGCSKSGPIPDGEYVWRGEEMSNTFVLSENEHHNIGYYWDINGNTAQRWVSSYVDYKADIVVENNKIYFNGFKWNDIFSSTENGSTTRYEVIYNEELKTITTIIKEE